MIKEIDEMYHRLYYIPKNGFVGVANVVDEEDGVRLDGITSVNEAHCVWLSENIDKINRGIIENKIIELDKSIFKELYKRFCG